MAELTFNIVRQAFKSQSVTQKDYLTSEQLYAIISRLNTSDFDEQTFQEIWDQCKLNSKGHVRVSDFIDFILKGEQLLLEKKQENENELLRLQAERKGKLNDLADQHKYRQEMETLIEEKEGVLNSLNIIRKPFAAPPEAAPRLANPENPNSSNQQPKSEVVEDDIVRQLFDYDSSETAGTLTSIFYVTCVLAFLTWLGSLLICQFLSMMVYAAIMGQFFLQIVSRKIVKFNLILLLVCTFFDILWLIIQTGHVWYIPVNYELPRMDSSFLKFSVILIILCACIRLILLYFYLSQFHIDEFQVYAIKVFGRQLNIQREAEPYSANKNPFSFFLQPYFNKPVEGDQIQ